MNLHYRSLWQAAAASLCLLVTNVSVAQEGDKKPEEQPARPERQEGERPEGQRGPRRQFTPEAMLERLDTNKDGKITKEEATEERWGFLERADADKNNEVTKEELTEFIKNMPRPQGPAPGQGFNPETAFKEMDKNTDGKLTKEEVPAERWERWTNFDADKDGSITQKEYTDAMARFRERFNQGNRPEGGNRPNRPEGERPSRPERDT